jgi:hypothetical protein
MSQVKNIAETNSTQEKAVKTGSFLKGLFTSSVDSNDSADRLSQHMDVLTKIASQTTTYLNHLLKDNQFMYKLSTEEISPTQSDIEYIRLKAEIVLDELKMTKPDGNESIDTKVDKIKRTSDEVIEKYVESVENLMALVNKKYEQVHEASSRSIKEYSFIELVVDLGHRNKLLNQSKKECKNTLKLRVGDNFGYPLQLNIQGDFSKHPDSEEAHSTSDAQSHVFHYPVNYSMILMGQLLPDINFIKGHLSKTTISNVSKISSIDVLNDPYEELEKLLPCTNALKHELLASMKFIENTEKFMENSVGVYLKEAHGDHDFNQLVSDINKKIRSLSLVLDKQSERTDISREGLWIDFPEVSSENYIAIHSLINYRIIAVKEQLEILQEICNRQFTSIPLFNLEVMERIL